MTKIKKEKPVKKEVEKKAPIYVSYSAAYELGGLVGRLRIPIPTYEDIERVEKIKKLCEGVINEHVGKVQEVFAKYGIKDYGKEAQGREDVNLELNALFNKPSSLDVTEIQLYSKEEFSEGVANPKIPFDGNDLLLLKQAIIKQNQ